MFGSDKKRAKRGGKTPLLSIAETPGSPSPDTGEDAATRHRRARNARKKATNPLLDSLASGGVAGAGDPPQGLEGPVSSSEPSDAGAPFSERPAFAQVAEPEPARPVRSPHADQQPEIFQPLIDPAVVASVVWRWRVPIVALTCAGLVVGIAVALMTPHRYTAYARILVDPREIKLVGKDITPDYLANEAALAIVDSQLELVSSVAVLGKVVERAGLDRDPEFNGQSQSQGGVLQSLKGFVSLFSAGDQADDRQREAINELRKDLWIDRTARTFVINVGVTTLEPEKSALLANEVAKAFIEEQEQFKTDVVRSASSALTSRLQTLKSDVEKAETALEDYRGSHGMTGADGKLVIDGQLTAVAAQLAAAKAATVSARTRAETAKSVDVDTVVAGGLPQDLVSPALVQLRTQFAAQRQKVGSLENALGARHPKLADAKAALSALQQEIAAELRRIVAGTQADLRRAVENEQGIAATLAQLKVASADEGDASVGLRQLEREAAAAREVYEAFLLRARETGQIELLNNTNIKVISPAEAPENPSSLSRKIIVAGYGAAGFALGLALAFIAALREMFGPGARGGPQGPSARGSRRERIETNGGATLREREAQDPTVTAVLRMANETAEAHSGPASIQPQDESRTYPAQPHYQWAPQPAPYAGLAMPQAMPEQMPADQAQRVARDEEELEDLRESLRDLRDTVDALMRRRVARGRRVA